MKAFLILGPEGSGTYMLWEALASSGCGIDISKRPENFTIRYSLPHAYTWPDLLKICRDLKSRSYEIQPLIILRDYYCTVRSVIRRDPERPWSDVEKNMARSLAEIGLIAERYRNTIYITYEAFCLSEGFRRWLFKSKLGLPEPKIEINFANEKWYE